MKNDRSFGAPQKSIERVGPLPLSELRSRYLDRGIPVIVEGHVTKWPAYEKWTPGYFAEEYGHRTVPVVTMRDGDYANASVKDMPLENYLLNIGAIKASDQPMVTPDPDLTYYLAEVSLARNLPDLLDDLKVPSFFPQEKYVSAAIYVGAHLFSQLHYHPKGSATLCLLHGQKRVRLFEPDQTRYLYPYPASSRTPNMSRTTHKHPDPEKFPDFAKAEYLEDTVRAGEMLFIPIYWWHAIENEDVSIATVFFWNKSWVSRFLPPPQMRAQYIFEIFKKPLYFGESVARKLLQSAAQGG